MTLGQRMKSLHELFNCRVGPGASILPRNVTKVHMTFSMRWEEGHSGLQRFWREYLPRVKYHNPGVSILVDRKRERAVNPEMIITFANRGAKGATKATPKELEKASAAGGPEVTKVAKAAEGEETTKVLNLEGFKEAEVFKRFLEATGGTEVVHTPEELAQVQAYVELNKKKEVDRLRSELVEKRLKAERLEEENARKAAAAAI